MKKNREKEQALLQKISAEFARKALLPEREENDAYPYTAFPTDILNKAYELGFFHTLLPESMEGLGGGLEDLCTVLTSICEGDAGMGAVIMTNAFSQEILMTADERDMLSTIVKSEGDALSFLIAFQIFQNPLETGPCPSAKTIGQTHRLSGSAQYMVLGGLADRCLVSAGLNGSSSFSYFLVDLNSPSVHRSEPVVSLGIHTCPAVDIVFDEAEGVLIGQADKGNEYYTKTCEKMAPALASMQLGIMKGSFNEAHGYCRKRIQGGKKIIQWSQVQMMLADMAYRLKVAETLVETACRQSDEKISGWEKTGEAAALYLQDEVCDFTSNGIQLLGGYGYIKDYGQEKYFRDAKQLQALMGIAPMKKLRYLKKHYHLS